MYKTVEAIHALALEIGIAADFRPKDEIEADLKCRRERFEKLRIPNRNESRGRTGAFCRKRRLKMRKNCTHGNYRRHRGLARNLRAISYCGCRYGSWYAHVGETQRERGKSAY